MGGLLPETGNLAFLAPPARAAVELALADVNEAGGVLGSSVTLVTADSGDDGSGTASQALATIVGRGAQAIVGPAASSVVLSIMDQAVRDGVVLVSPSSTSPGLTDFDDAGLLFRMAPSDSAQGSVLATVALDLDLSSGASIARSDAYGLGVQAAFDDEFVAGGGAITASLTYGSDVTTYAPLVAELAATQPDVVLIAGFDEAGAIIREMIRQGVGPQETQVLLAEASVSKTAFRELPKDVMAGAIGAIPASDPEARQKGFHRRLLEKNSGLTTFAYGAEAYDAAILLALAAEYSGCADGANIAQALPLVANERPGSTTCTSYAQCLEVIGAGGEPRYVGVAGRRDFNEFGDAQWASIEVVRYLTNSRYESIEVIGPGVVPAP